MGGRKVKKAQSDSSAAVAPVGRARWLKPDVAALRESPAEDVAGGDVTSPEPPAFLPPVPGARHNVTFASSSSRMRPRTKARRYGSPTGQPTVAEMVDRHACYELSVQEPRKEISNIIKIHREVTKELSARREVRESVPPPRALREDFCGTAILSREWALRNVQNVAYGVDIDPEVVRYARERTLKEAKGGSVEDRVQVYVGDALTCEEPPQCDIVAVMNYSCFYFHRRADLIRYFRRCVANLRQPGGMFIFDAFAGSKTGVKTKATRHGWFTSYFEHKSLDVMTNVVKTALHFRFNDGSWLRNAFSYDFRVYSIVELREAMSEAGFRESFIWVSSTRERECRTGEESQASSKEDEDEDEEEEEAFEQEEYVRVDGCLPQMESYNVYVVGLT